MCPVQDGELRVAASPNEGKDEDLVDKFKKSKAGWRRKPATAERQSHQLTNMFRKVSEVAGEKGQILS